jgi:hypothetical protein
VEVGVAGRGCGAVNIEGDGEAKGGHDGVDVSWE